MTTLASTVVTSSPLWYATRATAVVAFVLLTASMALGVTATRRSAATRGWPRFATQQLHRNISVLGVAFLLVHILTTLADSYVSVGWLSFLVPGTSGYRRPWVALGTLAFDALIVVTVTSLLRDRLPVAIWRAVHWTVYAAWPLAFLHFLKTGTDAAHHRWGLWLALACLTVVAAATTIRLSHRDQPSGPVRSLRGDRR